MKKVVLMIVSLVILSCSNDENPQNTTIYTPINQPNLKCSITGATVSNPNTNNAYSTIILGNTATYKYNSSFAAVNVQWSVYSANPSGSITINNPNSSNVSVTFTSGFESGSIQAIGSGANGQFCGPILSIKKLR